MPPGASDGPGPTVAPGEGLRVGVDVGGTFTHAVAVAAGAPEVAAHARVPTTHDATEGVAAGVVAALRELIDTLGVSPAEIRRVAHSTTQATNALLEGDVAPVGVLAVGRGWEGRRVAGETDLGAVDLAPGRALEVGHRYLELGEAGDGLDVGAARKALEALVKGGARTLVVAAAFSVDDPQVERRLLKVAESLGVPATATSEISGLYGLRMRTRTAVINAAILPEMLATATRTEAAVRRLGITAPLVVMRSDGGAMGIDEMRRRPLLTLMSGPAAGVAAALMAAGVSDGLFLEVGGTSTDISCFVHGRPRVRAARVGEHRLFLDTVDVRAVGVAGGSMIRAGAAGEVRGVGPRSAHIAGLRYAAFEAPETGERGARVAPRPGDPPEYLAVGPGGRAARALTPTCAAAALGRLDFGDRDHALAGFARAGEALGVAGERLAEAALAWGRDRLARTAGDLVAEYRLDPELARLVAGGGGGAVWGPEVAAALGLPYELAPHAPVISAVGAALALLQETVERSLPDPTPADLLRLRAEAQDRLLAMGAAPETVEVRVEADPARGVARAVATGAHELEPAPPPPEDPAAIRYRTASLFGAGAAPARVAGRTPRLTVVVSRRETPRWFGLSTRVTHPWRVLDRRGRVRLGARDGEVLATDVAGAAGALEGALTRLARWGDAGRRLPDVHLLCGARLVDLSGLPGGDQRLALLHDEVAGRPPSDPVVLVVDTARD